MRAPHAIAVDELADRLRVDPTLGLETSEAERRLATHGSNELEPPRRTSVLASLVDAATEPFVVMLALAGGLAVILGFARRRRRGPRSAVTAWFARSRRASSFRVTWSSFVSAMWSLRTSGSFAPMR